MSGIYIPGMGMPKSCSTEACFVRTVSYEDGTVWCPVAKGYLGDQATVCPLVPVPPHGRLIDAAELQRDIHEHDYVLVDKWNSKDKGMFTNGIDYAISVAPTIIPAEEGET